VSDLAAGDLHGSICALDQSSRFEVHPRASGSQLAMTRMTKEEWLANLALQPQHLSAQARLGTRNSQCSSLKVQLLGEHNEVAQLLQIHEAFAARSCGIGPMVERCPDDVDRGLVDRLTLVPPRFMMLIGAPGMGDQTMRYRRVS
jgi:hypothetical protein